jgi:hypothetical protein
MPTLPLLLTPQVRCGLTASKFVLAAGAPQPLPLIVTNKRYTTAITRGAAETQAPQMRPSDLLGSKSRGLGNGYIVPPCFFSYVLLSGAMPDPLARGGGDHFARKLLLRHGRSLIEPTPTLWSCDPRYRSWHTSRMRGKARRSLPESKHWLVLVSGFAFDPSSEALS